VEQWDPDARKVRPPSQDWCPILPFWHGLGERGQTTVAYDVPFSNSGRTLPNIVEILGWGMHEGMWHSSEPPGLIKDIETRFGVANQPREGIGERPLDEIVREVPGLLEDVRLRTTVIEDLAARYPWQLFIAIYTEPHRAGHWYWGERATGTPQGGLKKVLVEIDRQIPRLEALLTPEDQIAVFSLHGMEQTLDADRLGEAALLYLDPRLHASPLRRLDPVYVLRHHLPQDVITDISRRFPQWLYNWAYFRLRNVGRDWNSLPYVVSPLDHLFYVTVNPPAGSGPEVRDELEQRMLEQINGMTKLDGSPAVEQVLRPKLTMKGARSHLLPDLAVRPSRTEIGPVLRLKDGSLRTAPRHGNRDGEHNGNGFYIQAGPGIAAERSDRVVQVRDLAELLCDPAGLVLAPAVT
jgi:hypothetical protein